MRATQKHDPACGCADCWLRDINGPPRLGGAPKRVGIVIGAKAKRLAGSVRRAADMWERTIGKGRVR